MNKFMHLEKLLLFYWVILIIFFGLLLLPGKILAESCPADQPLCALGKPCPVDRNQNYNCGRNLSCNKDGLCELAPSVGDAACKALVEEKGKCPSGCAFNGKEAFCLQPELPGDKNPGAFCAIPGLSTVLNCPASGLPKGEVVLPSNCSGGCDYGLQCQSNEHGGFSCQDVHPFARILCGPSGTTNSCDSTINGKCINNGSIKAYCQYPSTSTTTPEFNCGDRNCKLTQDCHLIGRGDTGDCTDHPKDSPQFTCTVSDDPAGHLNCDLSKTTCGHEENNLARAKCVPISKAAAPAPAATLPQTVNPTTGEIVAPEVSTSQVCVYSQQDSPGSTTGCASGLIKDGKCQFDERVSQPLTEQCKYTKICYQPKNDNSGICNIGVQEGAKCVTDVQGLGQPISCADPTVVNQVADAGETPAGTCSYTEGKYSCDIKVDAPGRTTCVYSEAPGKCFVGECIPHNPLDPDYGNFSETCKQGSFNDGCHFASGLGQSIKCPFKPPTVNTASGDQITVYATRPGKGQDDRYQGYEYSVSQHDIQGGVAKITFPLQDLQGLNGNDAGNPNGDQIIFCAHFPASYYNDKMPLADVCTAPLFYQPN